MGLDRKKEAEAPLTKAFALSPDLAGRTLAQLALDDFSDGDADLAFKLLAELTRRQTQSASAWFYQGFVQMKVGQRKDARKSLEKARKLDPNLSGLQEALAALDR